jgi:hypothetical protein
MRDLLVIMPSRGRSQRLREFLSSFQATREAVTDVAVALDNDDPDMAGYDALWDELDGNDYLIRYQGPRRTIVPWINYISREELDNYTALCVMGDDDVPITAGWDLALLDAIRDMGGTGFSYPNDKRRDDIPEIPVVSTNIIKALGWFCLPTLKHFYVDNVWGDLGIGADCIRYCSDVVVEHRHYLVHAETQRDMTYAQSEVYGMQDQRAYAQWQQTEMKHHIAIVRSLT